MKIFLQPLVLTLVPNTKQAKCEESLPVDSCTSTVARPLLSNRGLIGVRITFEEADLPF